MYNYIHTEIKTYRHTQTNRQTDSPEVQEGRHKNIQMYSKTIAYLKIDRQTEQTSTEHTSTERQRDRQTDRRQYICAVQKYSDRNLKIKKVSNRLRLRIFFL